MDRNGTPESVVAVVDKVPRHQENPIDAWILSWTAETLPFFRSTGHTPNMITTYSFICGLAAVACLWGGSLVGFAALYALSYVFDCMDGQFARKYKMTSRFGDLYDHATDLTVYALVGYTVYTRCPPGRIGPGVVTVFGVALALLFLNIGCQQRLHRSVDGNDVRDAESLDVFRFICPCTEWVRWARFGGYATFNIVTVALVTYLLWDSVPGDRGGRR